MVDTAAEVLWRWIENRSATRTAKEEEYKTAEHKKTSLIEALVKSREAAERAAAEATDLLAQFVPHDWLYTKTAERREFRGQALNDRAWCWELELDDLHVAALIHFAHML